MHDLAEQVVTLQQERQRPTDTVRANSDNTQLMTALVRLSSEVNQLRARLTQLENLNAGLSNQLARVKGAEVPFLYADATQQKDYTYAGYSTPQAAVQSVLWAITQEDAKAFQASLTGDVAAGYVKLFQEYPDGVMPGGFKNGAMHQATGFRILEETRLAEDEMLLKVFLEGGRTIIRPVFKKVGGEWKWARNEN